MKINRRIISSLFIIVMATFIITFPSCTSGGGGTGGGGSTSRSKHEMAVLSVNTNNLGNYSSSNSETISRGTEVVVTIGLKTADAVDTCGYQCSLQFDSSRFALVQDRNYDLLKTFDISINTDSKNANMIRLWALPKIKNGHIKIKKQSTQPLVQLVFKAADKTGAASFKLVDNGDFINSVSSYSGDKPVSIAKLMLGDEVKITVSQFKDAIAGD